MNNLMNASKSLKRLWLVLIITTLLVNLSPTTAFADDANPPTSDTDVVSQQSKTVPIDPNRYLSPEEIKLRDAKYRALKQFLQLPKGSISASVTLIVGTWKEPNDLAHVNHCGPGATQVALDARWMAAKVYDIDKIGRDELTNVGGKGTAMQDIVKTLNRKDYLGSEFPNQNGMQRYWWDGARGSGDLFSKIAFDTTRGYALISGVRTKGMPGWGIYDVDHIVAVIGYRFGQPGELFITYTDTSSRTAKFYGSYRNTVLIEKFYGYVLGLNTLAW
jgi:hypothetical protein